MANWKRWLVGEDGDCWRYCRMVEEEPPCSQYRMRSFWSCWMPRVAMMMLLLLLLLVHCYFDELFCCWVYVSDYVEKKTL